MTLALQGYENGMMKRMIQIFLREADVLQGVKMSLDGIFLSS